MKKQYYALKDQTVGEFLELFPARNDDEAKRMVGLTVLNSSEMAQIATDLDLFRICELDTKTGIIGQNWEKLANASELAKENIKRVGKKEEKEKK